MKNKTSWFFVILCSLFSLLMLYQMTHGVEVSVYGYAALFLNPVAVILNAIIILHGQKQS